MTGFMAVWLGQLVSLLGSGLTAFGLAVWVFQSTGNVGDLAIIAAAIYVPHVALAPYAGVLADRYDRRSLLIMADTGAAVVTGIILWSAWLGTLGPLTAAALVAVGSACNALQMPAFEAATVALVPKDQLGRANGLCELSRGTTQLLAPVLGGALYGLIGLEGLVAVDLISFVLGMVPLLMVRIPPRHAHADADTRTRWIDDVAVAWRFVARRRGLVVMLILFSATNFTFAVVELLLKPLVLSFAGPLELGIVLSTVGVGMVAGSVVMAAWGGPRRKVLAILAFQIVEGGALVVGGLRPSLALMCCGAFAYGLVIPLTFGIARTLWQVKVPHELQGRVSALRNAILMLAIPVGYAVATPLAEWLEPLLAEGGSLSHSVGAVIGVGAGRGSALVVILMGVVTWASALACYAAGAYRRVEAELNDMIDPCDAPESAYDSPGSR